MPVVTLYLNRLKGLLKARASDAEIKAAIPYLGLDLEEEGDGFLRVEYNPNRPDYSTDAGVARGLNGFLGYETGTPRYNVMMGNTRVVIDPSILSLRAHIVCLKARGLEFDEESIRQLISMQEDLHNGLGRRRQKVSIGLHNFDVLDPPFRYGAVPPSFRFPPLGQTVPMTIAEILGKTEAGRTYGHLVKEFTSYPVLADWNGRVLSFPPIINGERTRVSSATKNLFVDVTGTDLRACGNTLSIVAAFLHDVGGKIETVTMEYPHTTYSTPNLSPYEVPVDEELVRRVLGLELPDGEIARCLARCRITAAKRGGQLIATIPRYRLDQLHAVDIVEEVAIGYGLQNFTPTYPVSASVGAPHRGLASLRTVETVLAGLGLIQSVGFSLIAEEDVVKASEGRLRPMIRVESSKSREHEILRSSLLPSLLAVLARNIHEEYPQRIFEVAKVFQPDFGGPGKVSEEYHAGILVAHVGASFTEAKSLLAALLRQAFNRECTTPMKTDPTFAVGRSAGIRVGRLSLGFVGEVRPEVLRNFQLRTPVAGLEVNLSPLLAARRG